MEFPHLGEHCSSPSCQQLDFLPMKCDACGKTFCSDHLHYENHTCAESYKKNNQVPVCPLCNAPCPVPKGERPDVVVGRHIDSDCLSDSAKQRRKIYTNKCAVKSCKQKELVPMRCETCQQNYCIRHRNELDHDCKGFEGSGKSVSRAGAAVINRTSQSQSAPSTSVSSPLGGRQPQQQTMTGLGRHLDQERRNRQAGQSRSTADIMPEHMTEDEALRAAMAMSMGSSTPQSSESNQSQMSEQEQEDLALAQALAASEEEARRQAQNPRRATTSRQQEKSCEVS